MKLVHRTVPRAFLEALPDGMKFIHRHGKEFLVVEELRCPAGHSLMCESVRIHGEPSIQVGIRRASRTSRIYVDAFWGSHAKLFDFQANEGESVLFAEAVCPTCGVSLMTDGRCKAEGCDSTKRIRFQLPREGDSITVCARLGCPDHEIHIGEVPQRLNRIVSEINFFGHGDEELFEGV